MDDCIFCKISKGEIPSPKIYEDASFFVFLDKNPVSVGHLLIIPKKHVVWMQEADDETISEIAKNYNKTNAQVLLCWSLQHGCIAIPKSTNKGRIQENIDIFDFELSEEDMSKLDSLNENLHLCWDPNKLK